MTPYRILLVSNQAPRSLWDLANRIERELQTVRVCGIISHLPPRDLPESEPGYQAFMDFLLGLVHVAKPRTAAFGFAELIQECERRKLPILQSDGSDGDQIECFVRETDADIALVVGTPSVSPKALSIPRYGSLRVEILRYAASSNNAKSSEQVSVSSQKISVKVAPPFSLQPAQRVISVQLPVQTFDTPRTIALVADLIRNDLLIRSVSNLCRGKLCQTNEELSSWSREMLLSCFGGEITRSEPERHQQFKRATTNWELRIKHILSVLVLFSPYVIARNWYRRRKGNYPVFILFHHLVSNRPHRMGIPTETFLRQVEFLQKHYRIVSLAEALDILHSGYCEVPTVCLTFDDGYEDNFLYLRAVAEATGIPVDLFVCTKAVESRQEFQHDVAKGESGFRALSWDQIRYWQNDHVEFGSHTRSHFDCGSSDICALEDEIGGSLDDMQKQLGTSPRFFAFPWGKACNMSNEALRIATSWYQCSFSTLTATNFAKRGRAIRVAGRKPLPSTLWELELTVQSIFDFWPKPSTGYNGSGEYELHYASKVSNAIQQK